MCRDVRDLVTTIAVQRELETIMTLAMMEYMYKDCQPRIVLAINHNVYL